MPIAMRPALPLPPGYTIEEGTGAVIPIRGRWCTVTQFMRRLSDAEYVALTAIRIDPATSLAVRAQLETLKEVRDNVREKMISLDDTSTQGGVAFVITLLAALPEGTPGRIDPVDVDARIAAWLADYPQLGEAP